jgi:hypothetical protein
MGCKGSHPITGLDRPLEHQKVEASRIPRLSAQKVARLSTLRTDHLNLPGDIPGNHFR